MSNKINIEFRYQDMVEFGNVEEYNAFLREFNINKLCIDGDFLSISEVEFKVLVENGDIILGDTRYTISQKKFRMNGGDRHWIFYVRCVDHYDYENLPF